MLFRRLLGNTTCLCVCAQVGDALRTSVKIDLSNTLEHSRATCFSCQCAVRDLACCCTPRDFPFLAHSFPAVRVFAFFLILKPFTDALLHFPWKPVAIKGERFLVRASIDVTIKILRMFDRGQVRARDNQMCHVKRNNVARTIVHCARREICVRFSSHTSAVCVRKRFRLENRFRRAGAMFCLYFSVLLKLETYIYSLFLYYNCVYDIIVLFLWKLHLKRENIWSENSMVSFLHSKYTWKY